MSSSVGPTDVLAVGEVMGLLDPDGDGPLEDVSQFALRVAGAEVNALIALSRLGHSSSLVSAVGDDPIGRLILRTLAEQGVGTTHVRVVTGGATGVFFKERFTDGLRRVYYYRSNSAASKLQLADARLGELSTPRVLLASGLSLGIGMPTGLASVAKHAITEFASRHTAVVFDANLRPGLWDGEQARQDFTSLRDNIDVLLAGDEELAMLVPDTPPDTAAAALCEQGMRAVVVKAGAKGSVVYEPWQRTAIGPFPVRRVVDPVGAGDAFAAGMVCGILRSWSMVDSCRLGARLGASAVTASGDWEAVTSDAHPQNLLSEYKRAVGSEVNGRSTSATITGAEKQ
jgi:2-dehydro-3-deoxygluconokinase